MSVFQQYNISPWLTPVRLAATSNQTGTYFNGTLNNGVGATLTYATGALTIDSVTVNVGDRVLLANQTNTNENGVYVCNQAGATGVSAILQRSADQQCIEQLHTGFYVTVAAGSVNAGGAFVMVAPKPAILGVSALTWLSQVAVGAVTFSGVASTANALAVFSDTAVNIKAASGASTFGQALAVTGNLSSTANLQGVNLLYGATPVAQVDPASCTITAAAGGANTATIAIQLKDGSGTNMARIIPFRIYASFAADCFTLSNAPSTGFTVRSRGCKLQNGAAITTQISCMSSATGGCVLSLLDTGKQTSYLVLVLSNGCKISAQLSAGSYG